MNRILGCGIVFVMMGAASCIEPIDHFKDDFQCSSNQECGSGQLCDPYGECVQRQRVRIRGATLPKAVVGEGDYSATLEAQEGIPPYTWTMRAVAGEERLGWLEIDGSNGELRAKVGEAPTESGEGLEIEMTLRDSSNGGAGETARRNFGLEIIECRADVACYQVVGGACRQGVMRCRQEELSEECELSGPSTDPLHCGAQCGPCPEGANRCDQGECRCASKPPCTSGEVCCGSGCVDLNTDPNNCGVCGRICDSGECGLGVCNCDPAGCPNPATEAWFCGSKHTCVCVNLFGTPEPEPCLPGQYCCSAKGCCLGDCDSPASECSNDCILGGGIWCYWGCCEECADEGECGDYEPANLP